MSRILIADPSKVFVDALRRRCFAADEVLECADGLGVSHALHTFRPDILILNLSLSHLQGVELLREASYLPPAVILITYSSYQYGMHIAGALGVRYVLNMPTPSGIRAALQFLEENPPVVRTDLRSGVCTHLARLGIPAELDGYMLLKLGIPLFFRDPSQALGKELYPDIACAMEWGTSQSVERSMRHAIRAGWRRRDDRIWREYFPPGADGSIRCPNIKKFLTALVLRLQQEQ